MNRSVWIVLGVTALVLVFGCCGAVGWFGYSKAQEVGRAFDKMSQFEGNQYALNEDNKFQVYVKGGGQMKIYEMGRWKGEKFERWRPGIGWKVIQDENDRPDFDFCDGYVLGQVVNRKLDDWVIHSVLGPTEQFDDGRFRVCVEYFEPDSSYIDFADGKSTTEGFFEVNTNKKGGDWAAFSQFQFGQPGSLVELEYMSPFVDRMDIEWLDGTAQGFFFKTSPLDFSLHEVRARFVMSDGSSKVVERWQFLDANAVTWWFFPFEGKAEEVDRIESLERPWQEFEIEGVEFEAK